MLQNSYRLGNNDLLGLHIEGIFRLSGAASEVHHLERALSSNQPVTDLNLAQYDIHAITGVVKKYLRRLPVPVIPYAYHDTFLQIAGSFPSDILIIIYTPLIFILKHRLVVLR